MRNATSAKTLEPPPLAVHIVEGRVLAELYALRSQVATLQQLVLQREPAWSATLASSRGLPLIGDPSGVPAIARGLDGGACTDQPPLFATFFGGFTVFRDHRQLSIGSSRPVCELGTYLMANAGRSVTRDALMDLLWPEVDPSRAAHRLHVAVSDLRRIVDSPGVASLVRLQDDSYQIAACSVSTDCELFEQQYQRARRHLLNGDEDVAATAFEAALELYTGEFLADHPYLEWAAHKRAHFAERQLGALTALCEHAAHRRDFGAVEEYARAILAVDNLREQAHRHLMRAHYYLGLRASAIRQYRACAADLERELGAAPSLLTQQLHDAICHDHELPAEIGTPD
jgi:DNA-binding SARP family transcriptional activator